jgi:hypothetical protein
LSDAHDEIQYYTRMLPAKESGADALGSVLNGMGVALGIGTLFVWPIFLGVPGLLLAGMSLPMARSPTMAHRFGVGFAITTVLWMIGLTLAVWYKSALWP